MKRILLLLCGCLLAVTPVLAGNQYAINLQSTLQPVDMSTLPNLELLKQYQLYTTEVELEGHLWHRLRLGFFPDEQSANKVYAQLKNDFPREWVASVTRSEQAAAQKVGRMPVTEAVENKPIDDTKLETPALPATETPKQSAPTAAVAAETSAGPPATVDGSADPNSQNNAAKSAGGSSAKAESRYLFKVAAVVNNNIISTYQLDKAVQDTLAKETKANQLSDEQVKQLRSRILEQMVNEELVNQRIKELNLQVSEADLDAAIEDIQKSNNLTRESLVQALAAEGMTLEGYREQLKKQIQRYRLLAREVNYKVLVTSSEIREYFRKHIDQYRAEPKVRVSHISYKVPPGATEAELAKIRKQADICRDQLLSGEDFSKVLAAQGEIASGGDMGFLVEQDLTEQLRNALAGLEVGQVTEPMIMNDQLNLFLVTERNPGDSHLFEKVSPEIEKILKEKKTEARFQEWTKELREQGHVEIRI